MAGGKQKALELLMTLEDDVSSQLNDIKGALGETGDAASKSAPQIQNMSSILGGMVGGAIMSQLSQLAGTMKQIAVDTMQAGAEAEIARRTFENLGGSVEGIESLRAATRGMVDDVSLMQQSSRLMAMGLAETTDEAARLSEIATQLGMAMGSGPTEAMENFTLMLANQSIERLDSFGISSGTVRTRILELMDATEGMTRETAFLQATMEQAQVAMGRVGEQAGTAAASWKQIQVEVQNLKTELGESFLPLLQAILPAVKTIVEVFAAWLKDPEMRQNIVQIAEGLAIILTKMQEFQQSEGPLRRIVDLIGQIYGKILSVATGFESLKQGISGLTSFLGMLPPATDSVTTSYAQMSAEIAATNDAMFASEAVLFSMASAAQAVPPAINASTHSFWAMGDAARDFMTTSDITAAETEAAWTQVSEAIKSAGVVDAMHEMAQLMQEISEDMNAGLVETQEAHIAKVEELQFTHNLKMAQEEQMYQAKRLLLQQSGKTDELAELDAKHTESQSIAEHGYSVQMQLQERALIDQEIMQMESYVAQLHAQQNKVQESLGLALLESDTFRALEMDTQIAVLETVHAGLADKLRIEAEAADKSQEIASLAAEGQIDAAKRAAQVYVAGEGGPGALLAAAESALGELRSKRESFQVSLPPLDLTAFNQSLQPRAVDASKRAGAASSRAARQATEPATKALSQVVKEIDDGVESAKNAIENLVDFEIPAGVEAGLAKFGEFVAMSVKSLYAVFETHDLKSQIDTFQEYLAPVTEILSLVSTALPIDEMLYAVESEWPNLEIWGVRLFAIIERTIDVLHNVRAMIDDDLLEEVAAIVENVQKVLSLINVNGIDNIQEIVDAEFPSMVDWGGRLAAMIERGVEVLQAVRAKVGDDMLKDAAAIVEDVEKVAVLFSLGGIEAMREIVNTEFPSMVDWGGRLAAMIERAVEVLDAVRKKVGDDLLVETAAIVENVQKVAAIFSIGGIAAIKELVDTEWPDLTAWGGRLAAMIERGAEVLYAVRATVGDEMLASVAAIVEDVSKVTQIFSVGGADAMKELVNAEWPDLTAWGARLFAMIKRGTEVLDAVEKGIGEELLDTVTGVSEGIGKVTSLFGIGGVEAMKELVDAEWPDLTAWGARLYAMIKRTVEVLATAYHELPGLEVAMKIAEGVQKVLGVLGVSLDFEVPKAANFTNDLDAFLDMVIFAAEEVKRQIATLPKVWADAEMFAIKAAENLQKVMGLLSIDLEIEMPKAPQAKIRAWSTAFQTMATLLLAEIEKIRTGPFGSVLEEAAEAAGQVAEVFDLTKIFSAMPDAMKVPPWGGTAFAQRVNRVIGEALDLLIPNMQELRDKYEADLLDLDDFVQLVSDQLTAVAGFIASLEGMGNVQVSAKNVKSVFTSIVGALQTAVQMLGQVDFTPIAAFGPAVDAMAASADGGQGNAALGQFVDATTRFDDSTLRFEAAMARQEAAMARLEYAANTMANAASVKTSSADYSSVGA